MHLWCPHFRPQRFTAHRQLVTFVYASASPLQHGTDVGGVRRWSAWMCAARTPAGPVSIASPALYLRLREINTRSASQNHSNTSDALANKSCWQNASKRLSSSVFNSRLATLSGGQANPYPPVSLGLPADKGCSSLLLPFPSQTLIILPSLFSSSDCRRAGLLLPPAPLCS